MLTNNVCESVSQQAVNDSKVQCALGGGMNFSIDTIPRSDMGVCLHIKGLLSRTMLKCQYLHNRYCWMQYVILLLWKTFWEFLIIFSCLIQMKCHIKINVRNNPLSLPGIEPRSALLTCTATVTTTYSTGFLSTWKLKLNPIHTVVHTVQSEFNSSNSTNVTPIFNKYSHLVCYSKY